MQLSIIEKSFRNKKKIKKMIRAIVISNLSLLLLLTFCISSILALALGTKNNHSDSLINGSLNGVPQELVSYFNEASEIIGLPNWMLAGIAKNESNFDMNCSYGGAYGIMQVQKFDLTNGENLWAYHMDQGLDDVYRELGYSFSTYEEMWQIYLNDARVQIIAGGYIVRTYANYVLWKQHKVDKYVYDSKENLKLIDWSADENDSEFRNTLRRILACYNGGPGYGMSVDLDNAKFDYPNKVYKSCMEYRGSGLDFSDGVYPGNNSTIEKAIMVGTELVGRSPYKFGGGRNPLDIANKIFDCSSFVHYCFAQAGVTLGDYRVVVTDSLVREGRKINSNEMIRGDLIFFDTYKKNGHVGIYLGDGKFLHDGTSTGVTISSLSQPYYAQRFNGNVRRIVESNETEGNVIYEEE
ncbi:C40 family peptidase [Terrisporobacter sp.]|uniref:C40 family peptidase n=1 Tax=Terrisporobacter sp. TaxID=1965305 RepID=UPI002ED04BEB